ncbi:hypothetical protein VKS41_008243 [Umbelopsis sp. WA50703]
MFSNKPQQQYQQQGYGYPPPQQGYYPPPPQQGYYQGPPPQRRDNSGLMGCLVGLLACCACEECLDLVCC